MSGDYAEKQILRMQYQEFDFGGGAAEVFSFRLPLRDDGSPMQGELKNIAGQITETFANDTTTGSIAVGTAADADAFGILNFADGAADVDCYDKSDDTDAIISPAIAAGTLVQVTLTNGTDSGTVAGKARPYIDILVW